MTPEQRTKLETMAAAARAEIAADEDFEAQNAFHEFVSDDLGVNTEDMQTAKAGPEELLDEALRRVEEKHLCDELNDYCDTHKLPKMSADDLVCEILAADEHDSKIIAEPVSDSAVHRAWLSGFIQRWEEWEEWRSWSPRPGTEKPMPVSLTVEAEDFRYMLDLLNTEVECNENPTAKKLVAQFRGLQQ